MGEIVHWHEGLFLRPHHLQVLQRSVHEAIATDRRYGFCYPWGVVESDLSRDHLEEFQIRFRRLSAVLPISGRVVRFPEHADLEPLDIERAFTGSSEALRVFLGVPHFRENRSNTIGLGERADAMDGRLHRVHERSEVFDENTGTNPQSMEVRHVNARLVLESELTSELEAIPVVRITRAKAGDRRAIVDDDYVPPCLCVSASARLRNLLLDLLTHLRSARSEYLSGFRRTGFRLSMGDFSRLEDLLKMQAVNRLLGRLGNMLKDEAVGGVPPMDMHLVLRDALAELAALPREGFSEHRADLFDVPDYDHQHCLASFLLMEERIRSLIPSGGDPVRVVQFRPEDGVLALGEELSDDDLTSRSYYLLRLTTSEDHKALADEVQDRERFKLMSYKHRHRNRQGIALAYEPHPPRGVSQEARYAYFRLVKEQDEWSKLMWEEIVKERRMAVRFKGSDSGRFGDDGVALVMPADTSGAQS